MNISTSFSEEILELIFKVKDKDTLTKLVNEYANLEESFNAYGNVSDTLPIKFWKFLNLENFISNLMNNDILDDLSNNKYEIDVEGHEYECSYKKVIKDYAKNNKTNLSFKKIMGISSPYLEVHEYEPIMMRTSAIIDLCKSLKVTITPIDESPTKDWGITYSAIDELAENPEISLDLRKNVIKNFSKLFTKWRWDNDPPARKLLFKRK